jgi:hypothetical protein
MDAVYLRPEDPELRRAWHTFPDPIMHDDGSGEVLQYMGSRRTGGGWQHTFRHRRHPETGQRQYWQVPALRGWAPAPGEDPYAANTR